MFKKSYILPPPPVNFGAWGKNTNKKKGGCYHKRIVSSLLERKEVDVCSIHGDKL